MYEYLVGKGLLTGRNSGFKKLDSTINQLINIVNNIYKGIDNRNDVCMIFLDISKAFDRVYHEGLLFKLKQLGIEGNLLNWIKSYLSNRKQRVLVNGKASDWQCTNAGVPQGSILGPLLFLVYINDIVNSIESDIYIFADDTSLMRPIIDAVDDFNILNEDLNKLSNWAQQWRVTFNAKKTEYMIFSLKNKIPDYPELFLGNTKIAQVRTHSHLGITFDSKLTWKTHINNICTKASQRVSNIKRIRHLIPRKTSEVLYKSLARPILEYGDVVFDNTTQEMKKLIEHVQRDALVMITCAYRRTPTLNLYKETGFDMLEDRRKQHRLVLFYKMTHNLAPEYLCGLVPPPAGENHTHRLRSSSNGTLSIPYARTAKYANSFIIKTTRNWNELDIKVRQVSTLNTFKMKIRNSHQPPITAALTGRASVHHTRMRLGLSPLREQLYKFDIIESPNCENCYIESESCIHYFLKCPVFTIQRVKLLSTVCQIMPYNILRQLHRESALVNVFLNGSDQLTMDENLELFETILQYISQTERFK